MKRTNFSRRFNKPDLNFQTIYTHSQSSGHIRIQSEIITNIRTASSFIFQHSKKPAKYKNDSQTAKSHLVSQNFYLNLFLSTFQRKNCKKVIEAVAWVSEPTHWANPFFGFVVQLIVTKVVQQLTRFRLTRRVARSVCGRRASCKTAHPHLRNVVRFCTDVDHMKLVAPEWLSTPKWAWPGSRDALLNFAPPWNLGKSAKAILQILWTWSNQVWYDNPPPKLAWSGSRQVRVTWPVLQLWIT